MNRKRSPKARPSASPASARYLRPRLHQLEDRTLPSVVNFTIDPSQSSLAVSGTVMTSIGNGDLREQGPGSLVTTYEGTIAADVDTDNGLITFLSDSSAAVADISGTWEPNVGGGSGSAPANYGAQTTISFASAKAAIRNLVTSASSDPLALNPSDTGYTFPSNQNLLITQGDLDYTYSASFFGSGHGTVSAAGQSAQNQAADGQLQVLDTQYALTAPVNVTIVQVIPTSIGNITVTLHIQGSITGYGDIPMVAGNLKSDSASLITAPQHSGTAADGQNSLPASSGTESAPSSLASNGLAAVPEAVQSDAAGTAAVPTHPALAPSPAAVDALAAELFGEVGGAL